MTDRAHELLDEWFGSLGSADLPTSDRTNLWFGDNDVARKKIINKFSDEFDRACTGKLKEWAKSPRGRLAQIILLDQFPRYVHRRSALAFATDEEAQRLCMDGMHERMDHSLTLIERVFFYMPLVHSESVENQETSIQLYQDLASLSMSETTQIYQLFLAYAYAHFRVIKEFGRFPQRNRVLGRSSTDAEVAFLKNS